jgi:hypothetical protein
MIRATVADFAGCIKRKAQYASSAEGWGGA